MINLKKRELKMQTMIGKSNRHKNLFTRDNSVVILVDYQEKFEPVLHDNEKTVRNIKMLLSGANIYKVPIVVSEQVPQKLGPTIKDFSEQLKAAKFFTKKSMSCCGEPIFLDELKNRKVKQVAVCGIEAHVCVLQTSLDLLHNGYQVHLVTDAITTRVPHNKQIAIEKIREAGAIISSVETILFEIAYEAGNEEFRQLQQLFKD